MTMPTTAMLMSGSGSLNGIAAQLSLPSMSTSCLRGGDQAPPTPAFPGPDDCLVDDALEQLRLDRAIGRRRHGFARLCQFGVAGIVERRPGAARLRRPRH